MGDEQPAAPQPVTLASVRHELTSEWLGLERGVLHTFVRLWREPAAVARRYVASRDPALVPPVRYMLVAIAGYTALAWAFLNRFGLAERLALTRSQSAQVDFVLQHAGWVVLVVVPVVAFVLWVFGAGRGARYVEALVLVAYTEAQALWVQVLVTFPLGYLRSPPVALVPSLVLAVYLAWAWAGYHRDRRALGWLAGIAALLVGLLLNQLVVYAALRLSGML